MFNVALLKKETDFHVFQNINAQAAIQAAQAIVPVSGPNAVVTNGQEIQGGPNTVLRVIIEHMVYPISLDILHIVSKVPHVYSLFNRINFFVDIPKIWQGSQNRNIHKK